jgi:hypothetical protein
MLFAAPQPAPVNAASQPRRLQHLVYAVLRGGASFKEFIPAGAAAGTGAPGALFVPDTAVASTCNLGSLHAHLDVGFGGALQTPTVGVGASLGAWRTSQLALQGLSRLYDTSNMPGSYGPAVTRRLWASKVEQTLVDSMPREFDIVCVRRTLTVERSASGEVRHKQNPELPSHQ